MGPSYLPDRGNVRSAVSGSGPQSDVYYSRNVAAQANGDEAQRISSILTGPVCRR